MKQEEMSLVVDRDIISLSTAQESIYVADILEGSGLAFIISDYREILGAIDTEFLSKAVELVLAKTPAYRSRLELVNDKPFLKVFNSADWSLQFVDLSHAPSPEIAAREWMLQEWKVGFDLFNGPLIKFVLIKIGTEHFFLFHCGHHIIVDGAGAYQFERNVLQVYDALVGGDKVEVIDGPNMAQNLEAAYLASENFEIDRFFWKEELSGIEPQQSLSGRLPVKDRLFHRERTLLSNEEVILLKKFCLDNKISLPRALVAFVSLYYARMTSQRDVIIELPVALRKSKADLSAVDMRSNAVFLRLQLDTTTSFGELLKIISVKMRGALKHQQYRWEYIQKEFGVDFNLALFSINILPSNKISLCSGIIKETHNFSNGPVRDFGITLYLEDGANEIAIDLDCNRALYSESETRVHLNRIHNFIVSLISVSSSDLIISLPLLEEAERKVVLQDFNATDYPVERATLPELFEAQVARSPEAIALIFGDEEVSYLELDQRANQLARYLISREIGAEDIVAIALDRSVEMIVSILGVLKSGAAYLPLDPDYPVERLFFMLKDSNAKRLITTREIYDRLLGEAGGVQPTASLEHGNITSPVSSSSDGSESDRLAQTGTLALVVALPESVSEESSYKLHIASSIEMLRGAILVDDGIVRAELSVFSNSQISDVVRIRPITTANLAYVIYTSGTTGRPKGVGVIHSALCNFFESYKITSENKDKNIGCLNAGVGFDVAVWEVFARLIQGNSIRLEMASIEDIKNLISDIKLHSIDSIYIPAGIVGLFNDFIQEDGCKLLVKEVLTGVESIRNDELHTLARCLGNPLIINGYGPTECTICSTWLILKNFVNNRAVVSIGSPISNTQIYILDDSLNPVPIGSIGELYIAGAGLARGYLGRVGLTSERFIACPFGKSGARMYRTGDLARWREDGTLEYVGRSDHQVKIRGFRVELGEIESALSKIEGVGQVTVQLREVAGEKRLVAYLVGRSRGLSEAHNHHRDDVIALDSSSGSFASSSSVSSSGSLNLSPALPSARALRAALLMTLPDYMVPSNFIFLDSLPLTPNGKLDFKSFPDPEIESDQVYRSPVTPTEILLCKLYAELTGASRVGLDDSFFALGGHSLLALRLISKVRDELGVELPVRAVFEHPTVESLTQFLSYKSEQFPYDPILTLRSSGEKSPLFCIVPSGATAVLYADLARHLRRDCSIYTLIPRGMEFGQEPFNSLEEEITIYLDEIIKMHPEGDINIIGFSTAGNIAHEIACALEDRGRIIRFVGLLDSPFSTTAFIEEEKSKRDLLLMTAMVAGLQLEEIADYSEMARIFWKHLLQQKIPLHVKTLDLMDRLLERTVLDNKMIKKLKPRRGGFDITYFIADAEEVTSEINARRFGWRHYCRSIKYVSVQTRHIIMLFPEPSKVIAAAIDDIFDTIGA